MGERKFHFSKIPNMEVATFDNSLSNFYGNGIEGTIKEDIQNALDARLVGSDEPVEVTITLDTIQQNDLPGMEHIIKHINALEGSNSYTKETIAYMQEKIKKENINVLTIEDNNTKGLTGAANGQSNNKNDTFGIYAYSKGVHFVDSNAKHETTRGGSHGIGKIANNAASDIHLMYFANCDAEYNQHVGGTIHLVEHQLDDQYYRSTGYFSTVNETGDTYYPYENHFEHNIFKKNTRGLKIIIPFVRDEFFDVSDIVQAICDNFFMAILKGNLVVNINSADKNIEIKEETLNNVVNDYYQTDYALIKEKFTPLYLSTYNKVEPQKIYISNGINNFEFDLYFNYDEEIVTGRVGIIRTIGMKIEDLKIKNSVRKPFNAILIGGLAEDQYLKSLENESHTSISADDIRDAGEKRRAKKFINGIHKEINQIINDYFQKENPTDGVVDTKDLIYETETSFKNELKDMSEKVKISSGKTVVKKKAKEERKSPESKDKKNTPSTPPKRKRTAVKKKEGDSSNDRVAEYIIPPSIVERISLKDKEIVRLNLTDLLPETHDKCNVSLKIIDGLGKESADKYNLERSFSAIKDMNNNEMLSYNSKKINDASIRNNIINLEFKTKDHEMNELKFLYEIEVGYDL